MIGGIFSITKPDQVEVQNPTRGVNKGEHLNKGERLKSEREKTIKVAKKKVRPCGFCKEMTNEHTKTTCPQIRRQGKKKERRQRLLMFEHTLIISHNYKIFFKYLWLLKYYCFIFDFF